MILKELKRKSDRGKGQKIELQRKRVFKKDRLGLKIKNLGASVWQGKEKKEVVPKIAGMGKGLCSGGRVFRHGGEKADPTWTPEKPTVEGIERCRFLGKRSKGTEKKGEGVIGCSIQSLGWEKKRIGNEFHTGDHFR